MCGAVPILPLVAHNWSKGPRFFTLISKIKAPRCCRTLQAMPLLPFAPDPLLCRPRLFLYLVLVFCLSNPPIQLRPWIVCLPLNSFHHRYNLLDLFEIENKLICKEAASSHFTAQLRLPGQLPETPADEESWTITEVNFL